MKYHFYDQREVQEELAELTLSTLETECRDDVDRFVSLSKLVQGFSSDERTKEFRKKYGSVTIDDMRTAIKILYDSSRVSRAKISEEIEFYRQKR